MSVSNKYVMNFARDLSPRASTWNNYDKLELEESRVSKVTMWILFQFFGDFLFSIRNINGEFHFFSSFNNVILFIFLKAIMNSIREMNNDKPFLFLFRFLVYMSLYEQQLDVWHQLFPPEYFCHMSNDFLRENKTKVWFLDWCYGVCRFK